MKPRKVATPAALLRALETTAAAYGTGRAKIKLHALRRIERRRLARPRDVMRLHEALCFLRAYPDDREVLRQVEAVLNAFDRRGDLRAQREALADSGIAGTPIRYRFYWPVARWLAGMWPDRLSIEWDDPGSSARIRQALPVLVSPPEAEMLKRPGGSARQWLDRLRAPGETDARFLVQRVAAMAGDDFTREAFHDALDTEYRLETGPDTPSRTRAKYPRAPVVFCDRAPSVRGRASTRRSDGLREACARYLRVKVGS